MSDPSDVLTVETLGVEITTDPGDQTAMHAWSGLTELLADWLMSAPDDGYVIIDLAWPDDRLIDAAPYVQFAVHGHHVRSEAASNNVLDPLFRLGPRRIADLKQLGWRTPTPTMGEGSTNFHRDDVLPDDAGSLARRLVATLRDVYGVPEPCFLLVCGFDDEVTWSESDLLLGLKVVRPRHAG